MPTATVSPHSGSRLAALGSRLGSLGLLALLAGGCAPTAQNDDGGQDTSVVVDPSNCPIVPSTGPSNPTVLGAMPATGQICPRGRHDWYSIVVPQGANLLDLSVGYPNAVTEVAILAQLYASDGMTPITDGEIVDTRTGARKGVVGSTLRVPAAGKYLIEVRDSTDSESDSLNSYVLTVATATDPDTHEPNDTIATAKPADAALSWLAYRDDQDLFELTVPMSDLLLGIEVQNPATAQTVLHYALEDTKGNVLGEGDAPPAVMPLQALRLLPNNAGGEYVVAITAPAGAVPDRRAASGYLVTLTAKPELDPNDQGTRNDSGATATCLTGAPVGGVCPAGYSGGSVTWSNQGQIDSLGDRDYFRFDVTGGAPAVLQLDATIGTTNMQLALDLLVPNAKSPCSADSDCAAINVTCSSDLDCEESHSCLPADAYTFCANGAPCRLCAGASACVPLDKPGGKTVCAAPQFLVHDTTKAYAVHTAQPVFSTGPYYVVVHDFQDDEFDYGNSYSLNVAITPEPDPDDQSANAAMRNNFYNPYPMDGDDLSVSMARAVDITAALTAGQPITGFISYASDEDWFTFKHPCPGMDCGLVFEWTQPGPSPVHVAFLMRRNDQSIHESFTYEGQIPTSALAAPVIDTFGDGDCTQCSFASRTYDGKYYWMQVRDVGSTHWDGSAAGQYSFHLESMSNGCPANCSEAATPMNPVCGCYCASLGQCPPGPQL